MHERSQLEALRNRYKQVEDLIEESRSLYRAVADSCSDGVVILRDQVRLYCNSRYLEILGFESAGDLPAGPPFPAAGPDNAGLTTYLENRRKGTPTRSTFNCGLTGKDGSVVPVAISASPITHSGAPALLCFVRDMREQVAATEELTRIRGHVEDLVKERTAALEESNSRLRAEITEHMRAEETLRRSEEKYRSILEHAVEGIFRIDPKGTLLSVNSAMAHMHGYLSQEELTASVTDVAAQLHADRSQMTILHQLLCEKGAVRGFEAQFKKKDGSLFWGSLNVRTEKDAQGNVLYYEGTIEDITSRKATEEELRRTMERLSSSLKGAISAMSLTVETRDPYTSGHQKKVSNLAALIAGEMGLSESVIDAIRMAGIIHDIGKMSVPAEILSKPRNLTDMEMNLLKVHPQSGYEILKEAELPYPIAATVLQHHERLDGSGYPQGLKGAEILLEARIIAVADVVEALASHRPYRPAQGIRAALDEIERNKGVLYDEHAVDACLKLFREKGLSLETIPSLEAAEPYPLSSFGRIS